MSVRVRFAPSPTGYLHVGGLRTALYNYLFARRHNGVCVLRIEDTDQTRLVENATENIIEVLRWAGIEFDESPLVGGPYGPYVQSQRLDIYAEYARLLLANGSAYYAFDTSEELDQMRERQKQAGIGPRYDRSIMRNQYTLGEEETHRLINEGVPYVLRLKVPLTGDIRFHDIVRGEIVVQAREVDDQVLMKSDGFPTYHLANVVDDHTMHITHVIRGEEWLPSTPKHVLLYQAFGWEMPQFAHLPLLLNLDRSKLSKRQGDVAVEDYRNKGYMPEALVNFVALLGWNPTADQEIFSMQELIDSFDLAKVNKAGAVFDIQKLDWMNSQYLRSASPEEQVDTLIDELHKRGYGNVSTEYAARLIELFRERVHRASEIPDFAPYMFAAPDQFDEHYRFQYGGEDLQQLVSGLLPKFMLMEDFTAASIQQIAKEHSKEEGVKMGQIINPLRLMLTGKPVGAGIFETMELLGREECIQRIQAFTAQ